jgi:hypothetical protein
MRLSAVNAVMTIADLPHFAEEAALPLLRERKLTNHGEEGCRAEPYNGGMTSRASILSQEIFFVNYWASLAGIP